MGCTCRASINESIERSAAAEETPSDEETKGFPMRYRLTLTLISSLALAGCAQTLPDPDQALVPARFTLDTPIEQLAASKEAASVLRKDLPGLLEDKHYPMFCSMSLRVIAALSNGDISAQTLAQTEADLRSVQPMIATAALK